MTIPRLIMERYPQMPFWEQGCLLIQRRRCFTASGGSCSFEWQGQGCVREGATGGDLVGALLVDPPSPPRPDQCPSRPPPPPPARASVTTAWVPVNPTVCPCPLSSSVMSLGAPEWPVLSRRRRDVSRPRTMHRNQRLLSILICIT